MRGGGGGGVAVGAVAGIAAAGDGMTAGRGEEGVDGAAAERRSQEGKETGKRKSQMHIHAVPHRNACMQILHVAGYYVHGWNRPGDTSVCCIH